MTTLPITRPATGPADPGPATARGSDYADLSRRVKEAGLFARRPGAYAVRAAVLAVSLAAGWGLFVVLGASWWQPALGVLLGALSTQVGFLGHDVGHRQVFRTRRSSYVAGLLLANVVIGLSYGWWLDKHNRHHAHPNDLDRDPDVAPGALVFDAGQAARRRGAARWLTRHQALLFFPMLLLEGLNLHVASARALRGSQPPARWLEGSLLLAHLVAYLGVVALVLPLGQALAFVAVQQGTFGLYMGMSFAPNHKGMPMERPGDNWDYLRRQVLTSRNIAGGPLVDRLLGGLNYQIEHHLFPSIPAPSLRRVQPIVRGFCAEHHLRYCEAGLVASFREVLGHLDSVSDPVVADRA